jgi:putative transposase
MWIDLFRIFCCQLDQGMDAALMMEDMNRSIGRRQIGLEELLIHADQTSHPRCN